MGSLVMVAPDPARLRLHIGRKGLQGAAKRSGSVIWRRQALSDGSSLKGLWHSEDSSHLGQGNLRPSRNRTLQPLRKITKPEALLLGLKTDSLAWRRRSQVWRE